MTVQVVFAALEKIDSPHEAIVARRLRVERNEDVVWSNRDILIQDLFGHRADAARTNDISCNTRTPRNIHQRLVSDRVVRITDGETGKIAGALSRRRNIGLLRSGLRPVFETLV